MVLLRAIPVFWEYILPLECATKWGARMVNIIRP